MGNSNLSTYLADRLAVLRQTQNPDGGWAFYAGKTSWLEPTVYASLALQGQPEAEPALKRAWTLVRSWQQASGGWRPSAEVPGPNWTTALAILLASKRGDEAVIAKGLEWLRNNTKDGAWSWRRTNLPAAEPTALAILALRTARAAVDPGAEAFFLADKLTPETCGPALLGLQGSDKARALAALAGRWAQEDCSAFTRAWIGIGLRVNDLDAPDPILSPVPRNLAVAALEALAAPGGNHQLLRAEARA